MSAWLELHTVLSMRLDAREAYRLMHNYRDEELQLRASIDVHAPAKWRVNGPLSNLTAFAEAFDCKVGAPSMMLPEDQRVTVF